MVSNSHPHQQPEHSSHFLDADSRIVDKILANELNSLSFDDREALSEEMHGVRSLAPNETPEMIRDALLDLQMEIDERLRISLSALPSTSSRKDSNGFSKNINGNGNENGFKNRICRREYLIDLLNASECLAKPKPSSHSCVSSADADAYTSTSVPTNRLSYQQSQTVQPGAFEGSHGTSIGTSSNHIQKNNTNRKKSKYSYALSREFKMKFLRAELFDVKMAAVRFLRCIDFLVDYFGLVALQRPLYITDLDRNEQKLLKTGRCQLLPSRDRFGRRIIVFLGSIGPEESHLNRFKVCMYLIFQVASDDETTQRNGLVALFYPMDDGWKHFFPLAVFQTETKKFFDAVPLRYSAFHFFLLNEAIILRGLLFGMIGKKLRLVTRAHTVSSVTETLYKLRCFGVPTEVFPLTSSGSIKTKKLMKWIKFRMALEEAHQRGVESSHYPQLQSQLQQLSPKNTSSPNYISPFLGIECPGLDTVIFRNGGTAWDHPGNVKFRRILARWEPKREDQKTIAKKNAFLDAILSEVLSSGLTFVAYDDETDWYVQFNDYGLLRKKVFQALRDQSARRKRAVGTPHRGDKSSGQQTGIIATHQVNDSSTTLFLGLDKNHDHNVNRSSSHAVKLDDAKRRRMSGDSTQSEGLPSTKTIRAIIVYKDR